MLDPSLESLLKPTLSVNQPNNPMYSVSSHVVVAFFGGIFSLLLFSMVSLRHIGRLKPYLSYYLIVFFLALAIFVFLGHLLIIEQWPDWLMIGSSEKKSLKIINQIIAVTSFGAIYYFQKNFFSISKVLGNLPKPWLPGIIAILIGSGFQMLVFLVITKVQII